MTAIVMALTMSGTTAFAKDTAFKDTTETSSCSMDEILLGYHQAVLEMNNTESVRTNSSTSALAQIQADTVEALQQAGYEAYDVNPQTYHDVEDTLDTDFGEIGLKPQYSYIVVLQGNAGNEYTYTYGGTVYTLRNMTITAADDPAMGKASDVDVLKSSSQTLIENCLNTAISAYIFAVSYPLGTVASICGLKISDFKCGNAPESTLRLNAATNWTREFTQVWSEYDNAWLYASCVEYAEVFSHMSGSYYDAALNKYQPVSQDESSETVPSAHYEDRTWRKRNAVIGYLNACIQYDTTGDVQYKYGGQVKITHRENF